MNDNTLSHEENAQVEGSWNQIAGKAKATWGDLTDDEIKQAEGNLQKLYGMLQEKTGETIEDIKRKLND